MEIKQVLAHPNNYSKGRQGQDVDRIVLHWIVGTLESADTTFQNPDRRASAHYGIGDDEIHQYVQEGDTAWHAGDFSMNLRSISIEHEGGWLLGDGKTRMKPSDKTHQSSSMLVAELCLRYDIPADKEHIIGHREVRNTQCPGSLDVGLIIRKASDIIKEVDMPITDKTKLDIGERDGIIFGTMELQAVRSTMFDQADALKKLSTSVENLTTQNKDQEKRILALDKSRKKLEVEVKALKEANENNEPVFTNSFSKFLYSLAKKLE